MRMHSLALFVALASCSAGAQQVEINNKQLIDRINTYKVGVGRLRQFTDETTQHQFGIKWNSKGSCGDFDMDYNIQNTLDKQDLQRMMDAWISKGKSAINAESLLSLAFKRANPDLYEKIQDGILQAKIEFDENRDMCDQIQNTLLDHAPDGAVEKLTIKQEYAEMVSAAHNSGKSVDISDMTDFIHDSSNKSIKVMGSSYGGKNEPPVESTKLTAIAGMNALVSRESSPASTAPIQLGSEEEKERYGVTRYFETVDEASEFATQLVGETEYRTTEDTNAVQNIKPLGVDYHIVQEQEEIREQLELIVTGIQGSDSPQQINTAINELNSKITPSMVTRVMFNELSSMGSAEYEGYLDALSNEFASQITIGKVLATRRVLYTGMLEASIQSTEFIPQDIKKKLDLIDWELDAFEREQRFKSYFGRNASTTLFERAMSNRMNERVVIQSNKGPLKP